MIFLFLTLLSRLYSKINYVLFLNLNLNLSFSVKYELFIYNHTEGDKTSLFINCTHFKFSKSFQKKYQK